MIFKNVKTGKVDQYNPDDVERINWLIRAKGYCLKFMLASGTIHRYDGFRDAVSSSVHLHSSSGARKFFFETPTMPLPPYASGAFRRTPPKVCLKMAK